MSGDLNEILGQDPASAELSAPRLFTLLSLPFWPNRDDRSDEQGAEKLYRQFSSVQRRRRWQNPQSSARSLSDLISASRQGQPIYLHPP